MPATKHSNTTYTLTAYKCGHYFMKIEGARRAFKICKRKYDHMLRQHNENMWRGSLPYVTVTHKETGRAFCMNRQYRLVPFRYAPSMVQQWDGWAPTNGYNQRPDWAEGLPDSEFNAIWHYK